MKLAVAALLLGLTGLAASLSQPLIPAFLNPNTGKPTQSRQSARLFLQSSELGLPHPSPAGYCTPPLIRGRGPLAARGGGRVPIPTRGHTLWYSIFTFYFVTEPVFVSLLRNPGSDSQPGGSVQRPYLSYQPARLHRTDPPGYIGWWNRFQGIDSWAS